MNLLNRKVTDFHLITSATRKKPRTFTELLHITRLPRKTLSLRLKELCGNGDLVKKEGVYMLNGSSQSASEGGRSVERISRLFHDRRMRTSLMLTALLISFSVSGYVFAMFFQSLPREPEPIGNFTAIVKVGYVSDVYGWQVGLRFNSTNLKVVSARPGDFLGNPEPSISLSDKVEKIGDTLFYSSLKSNILVLCQTLERDSLGVSGSGTLAVVEFEYYHSREEPQLIFDELPCNTMLLKMDTSEIPLNENTIIIQILP